MADQMDTPETRFWAKVDRRGPDECWHWLAYRAHGGHGIYKRGGRAEGAHRVSYKLCNGDIAPGLVVRHVCDTPWCVNPSHLVLGTLEDNRADWIERGAALAATKTKPMPLRKKWKSGPAIASLKARLLGSVSVDAKGCWNWTKAKFHYGHGAMNADGKLRKAHRVAYEIFCGPIPRDMHVLHQCDNPPCCNPKHLRVGTHADNMRDMRERDRAARGTDNHFGRLKFEGEANSRSRLTEESVREIRAATSSAGLAEKFAVSYGTIASVRARQTWRHVE